MFWAMVPVSDNEVFYYFRILHSLSIFFEQALPRISPNAFNSFACRQTFILRCVTLTFSYKINSYPKYFDPNSFLRILLKVIGFLLNDPPGKYLYKSFSITPLKPPKTYISLQGQTEIYTSIKSETYQKPRRIFTLHFLSIFHKSCSVTHYYNIISLFFTKFATHLLAEWTSAVCPNLLILS